MSLVFRSGRKLPGRALLGMVHVRALPGSPLASADRAAVEKAVEKAVHEARALQSAGFDGIVIENMHDTPYVRGADSITVACMTRVATEVRRALPPTFPCGIQVLASANREAMAIARATDFDFVRVEGFVFGHVADEGYTDACAGELLRYRREIDAQHVHVFADIKKKHSAHAITADVSIAETADAAAFFGTDGVIITGTATGVAAAPMDVSAVRTKCPKLPVLIGSGVTPSNISSFPGVAGFIVGSWIKEGGHWAGELDMTRCAEMVEAVRAEGVSCLGD